MVTVGAASVLSTGTIQPTSSRGPIPKSNLTKPDIVGLDYVPIDTYIAAPGTRIDGTSLAAPHVAGLAALVKQRNPTFTPAQIATYLKDNALPRGEPDPNNTWGHGLAFLPHIGPVITGDPRIGDTLTANTDAVDDIDGVPASPTFTYQWIRVASDGTEANISTATSATYTAIEADLNSTLKVQVSFTDSASTPNAEVQKSVASLRVVPLASANTAATGKPTISGPAALRVTHTLTAGTSAISDSDGVTGVTFAYQWVRVDGGVDTDIAGATESSYVLEADDEGKTVKVRVSFADNNRNAESVVSDASTVVGSAPNRPPTFPDTTASREVEENTPADQDIGDALTATDLDSDTLTYAIQGGSTVFKIDTSGGQLQTMGALNYEDTPSYSVVVEVTDNKDIDGMADTVIDDTIAVTITVTDVDEPAIIDGPQTVDWNENTAGTIATYTATDPDPADDAFLTLTDAGDAGFFDFSSGGQLSFKPTRLPDFEGPKTTYSIELGADDDLFATDNYDTTYAVTINIRDVNEAPVVMRSSGSGAFSIEENSGTTVGSFDANDPEGDPVTWSLVPGGNSGRFEIDATSGELSLKEPADYESSDLGTGLVRAYNVTVRATEADDGDPLTSELMGSLAVTVRVTDVNEPPVITGNQTPSVRENTTAVETYSATDPEGVAVTWSLQGGAGVFTISSAGALAFTNTSRPNYEVQTEHTVTVRASDGTNDADHSVTVTVADVDEPEKLLLSELRPLIGADYTASFEQGTGDDVQSPTWAWGRSTSSTSGFSPISGETAATYVPATGDSDSYLRVTASYNDGHSNKTLQATSQFVTAATAGSNMAPTFPDPLLFPGGETGLSVRENATGGTVVGTAPQATDPENKPLSYSLEVTGFTTDPPFVINATSRQIRVAPGAALDHEDQDTYSVTVTAEDDFNATGTATFDITIEDVNERPVAVPDPSVRTDEDMAVDIDVLTNDFRPGRGRHLGRDDHHDAAAARARGVGHQHADADLHAGRGRPRHVHVHVHRLGRDAHQPPRPGHGHRPRGERRPEVCVTAPDPQRVRERRGWRHRWRRDGNGRRGRHAHVQPLRRRRVFVRDRQQRPDHGGRYGHDADLHCHGYRD